MQNRRYCLVCRLLDTLRVLNILNKISISQLVGMDPNARKRKVPPVPKFEPVPINTEKVQEQVTDFLNQISNEKIIKSAEVTPSLSSAPKAKTNKFNLTSINSKLNNLLNAKNIDLNKVSSAMKKTENLEEPAYPTNIYDPECPNSYETTREKYVAKVNHLRNHGKMNDELLQRNLLISQIIANYELSETRNAQEQSFQYADADQSSKILEEKQSLALRMMQKFGYRLGEGLGKQSQGIRTPLVVKKTTDSSCRIEPSELSLASFVSYEQAAHNALVAFQIEKTCVVVLEMQLKLSQLDEQVEQEIRSECSKSAEIEQWIIYAIDKKIRIFIRFANAHDAWKVFVQVNGRYYDGKRILVHFYDQKQFQNKHLSLQLHKSIDL